MPNLNRVAQRPGDIRFHPDPMLKLRIMKPGELRGVFGVPRQKLEEAAEPHSVSNEVGRELTEDRSKLSAQSEHAGAEEVRKRRGDIASSDQAQRPCVGREKSVLLA